MSGAWWAAHNTPRAMVSGRNGYSVRFEDGTACCTCTYAPADVDKTEIAKRIAAALNLTRNIPTELLEKTEALVFPPRPPQ